MNKASCAVRSCTRPHSFVVAFLSVLLVLVAISCSHENRLAGNIYYRLNANPTTLDPALIVDVTGGAIAAKIFNGLIRLDEDMQVVPDLAEDWTTSRDGLTYTFRLRKGVTFSHGRSLRASDVKYSFERVLDPKTRSPNTWVLEKIAGARDFLAGNAGEVRGIRVPDGSTVEIRLEEPFSPFLNLLSMTAAYVVPEDVVERRGPEFSSDPVGTGPFVMREWLQGRELRLEKRQDYFGGEAAITGIVYRIIPEDLTAMTEFELGNLDVLTIPASGITRYRDSSRWRDLVTPVKGVNTYYVGMNCSRPPFDNPTVRRAMNHAIDRERLLATFYERRGRFAAGPVPDLLRRWNAPEAYAYNPERARSIFQQEGLSGATVYFYVTADQEVVDMAELIQSYCRKAGVRVVIRQLEWSAFKEAVNRGEADMFWLSWWADYPDPENFLFPLFHSSNVGPAGNRARYRNTEVDGLIERGQTSSDERRRNTFYERAEELIVQEAPWVFFWHKTDYTVRQPWIKHYAAYPIYSIDKGTDISF